MRLVPTRDKGVVVEKKTSIAVIVPARGMMKAKFDGAPQGFVKSIIFPEINKPEAEFPNPTKAALPATPPVVVVKMTGVPDANGMIVELPLPAGPVGQSHQWLRLHL